MLVIVNTKVRVVLLARQNRDGVVHKYRLDQLADGNRATISPACDPDEQHDRAYVATHEPSGPWCGRGCLFFPDVVMRTPP